MKKFIKSNLLLFVFAIGNYDTGLYDGFARAIFPSNNLIGRASGVMGRAPGAMGKASGVIGNVSGIGKTATSPTALLSNTSNGIIGFLNDAANFAKSLDKTAKDVSAAGKGLVKTASETKVELEKTKEDWTNTNDKKISSNPKIRNLETEKRKLAIERQARELKHNKNIMNIKQQMNNIKQQKEQKMNAFDQQILKARDDLQRQQLELQKSQSEFDYDKKLEEYTGMLEKAENSKEADLLDIKTRISVVNNQISDATQQEEKHQEAKNTMNKLVKKTGIDSISREDLAREAEKIRHKNEQQAKAIQQRPEPAKNKLTVAEQAAIIRNNLKQSEKPTISTQRMKTGMTQKDVEILRRQHLLMRH